MSSKSVASLSPLHHQPNATASDMPLAGSPLLGESQLDAPQADTPQADAPQADVSRHRPFVEVQALSKSFSQADSDPAPVLGPLSLTIAPGTILGVIGMSGAGKSTLLRLMSGELAPSQGLVTIQGLDVVRSYARVRKLVGVVPQEPQLPHPQSSLYANLLAAGQHAGMSEGNMERRARTLLRALDLWPPNELAAGKLAQGMRQKLALASALLHNPALLLLDEPFHHLDIAAMEQVRRLLHDFVHNEHNEHNEHNGQSTQNQPRAIVIATHQIDVILALCNRVAILHHGQLICEESVDQLLAYTTDKHAGKHAASYYEITIQGELSAMWTEWFDGMSVRSEANRTILAGMVADQAALHGLLMRVRDLGLPLLSLACRRPELHKLLTP